MVIHPEVAWHEDKNKKGHKPQQGKGNNVVTIGGTVRGATHTPVAVVTGYLLLWLGRAIMVRLRLRFAIKTLQH